MDTQERDIRRKEITEAAITCFTKYGVQKTSMADIAKSLGVSTQSLYYYFTDKNDLVTYVINHIADGYLNGLASAYAAADTMELMMDAQLECWVGLHERYYLFMMANRQVMEGGLTISEIVQLLDEKNSREVDMLGTQLLHYFNYQMSGPLQRGLKLYLTGIKAITREMLYDNLCLVMPDTQRFKELRGVLRDYMDIFMTGIRIKYDLKTSI